MIKDLQLISSVDKRGQNWKDGGALGLLYAPFSKMAGHPLCLSPHGDTMDAIHLPAPIKPETTPPLPFLSRVHHLLLYQRPPPPSSTLIQLLTDICPCNTPVEVRGRRSEVAGHSLLPLSFPLHPALTV